MPQNLPNRDTETPYSVRTLTGSDVSQFRELRLAGLLESPAAFGQTADEFARMSAEELVAWVGPSQDKFIIGAFNPESKLVGVIGVTRQNRERIRHKANIWGVYVVPSCRGQGISRSLFRRVLDDVETIPGVLQLQLCVASSQTAAIELYRSFGFKEFGLEPRALALGSEFIDELHLWLPL